MATQTLWGTADHKTRHARGIIWYGTPSHGGFHLSPGRMTEVPPALRTMGEPDGRGGRWFEEDCEWPAVSLAFPHIFPDEQARALECLKNWHPIEYELYTGNQIDPEDCSLLRGTSSAAPGSYDYEKWQQWLRHREGTSDG